MRKTLFFSVILLLLASCKEDTNEVTEDTSAFDISTENWPKKLTINAKAALILENWPEFKALDATFDGLNTVENTEDLILVIEDLIEKQKLLADSVYPESFDKPQIKSRQKVFQTFILKVKGDLEYRTDPEASVLELFNAYNAIRTQFGVITNNTLDIKTLLEEV